MYQIFFILFWKDDLLTAGQGWGGGSEEKQEWASGSEEKQKDQRNNESIYFSG